MIVTVTLNAALDRTLTVPNFQLGQRHRASQVLTLAGGKGINIARALKRLDVPVVATGLAGGRTGTRIVEELTAEAILNDFVRIGEESRTSTAVVDPTAGSYTEINEWGPKVTSDELEMLLEKLHYLSPRRRLRRLRRLAAARRRGGLLRRGGPRPQPPRRPRRARLGGRAAAARDRGGAVARLAEPARGRARRRAGARGRGGLPDGARHDRRARRAQRAHHARVRLLRALPRGAAGAPLPRECARELEPVSVVGAGDVLLAQFIAAHLAGKSAEEALRLAVAAGAASTLEVGAGRFDPREAGRMVGAVEVVELAPVG